MIKKAYLHQHLWGYLIAPTILLVLANGTGYMLMFCFPRIFHHAKQGKGGKSTMNRNSPSSFIKCTGQCFRVVCVCCMCMCVCVCVCVCECSMAV